MIFLSKTEVLAIHSRAIEEFGGSAGLRNEGALESALVAAENRSYYEGADLCACAATYAYHLTQAHAFVDGNKRVAAASTEVFIILNGGLDATDDELYDLFLKIASSELGRDAVEESFRRWLINESSKGGSV